MTGLSFTAAVALATNPEVLPGVQFVRLQDLKSHPNYHSCESLEKAQAALREEGRKQPVRADIMESYCQLLSEVAEATRNGNYRLAITGAYQVAARLKAFKSAQGVRSSIPVAVRHIIDHAKFQEKAGQSVKAHVGRTMQRVSEFSQRKAAEREAAKQRREEARKHRASKKNRKGNK